MYVNECIWSIFWHIWKPSGGQTGNRFQLEWLLRHFNTKPGQTHGLGVFFPQWFGAHSWVLAVECGSSQSRWFLDRTTDALGFKHEIHGTQMSLSPDPIPIVAGQSSVPNVGVFSNQWGHSWVTKWLMSIDAIHACLCCLSFTFWKRPKISQFRCLLYHQKKSMVPHFSQVAEPWPLWNHLLCDGYHLHAKLEPGWQLHNRRSATSITAEVGNLWYCFQAVWVSHN